MKEKSRLLCGRFEFESGLVIDAIRAAVKGMRMPARTEANLLDERDMIALLGEPHESFRDPYCLHEKSRIKGCVGEKGREFYELIFTGAENISRLFIPKPCAIAIANNSSYR